MHIKVCKFGGSSVKDSSQIKKVFNIVKEDKRRRVVVVSAPGRDKTFNEKITDHLLNLATNGNHFFEHNIKITPNQSYDVILYKFKKLCEDLDINKNLILKDLKDDLENNTLLGTKKEAFFLSRGEHYNAKIIYEFFKKVE